MEMVPEARHEIVNYGSEQFADRLDSQLNRMTPEEEVCRRYYRLEQGLEAASPEESARIRRVYQEVIDSYFQTHTGEPYGTRENICTQAAPIVVRKRSRYFPQVQYCCRHFEFIYVYSGQCELICKGTQYELRRGDFCLLEYGVPYRIVNHSDDCVILELVVKRKLLDRICDTVFRENSVLSRFLKNTLYGIANYPMVVFHTDGHPGIQYYVYAMYHEFRLQLQYCDVMLEALLNGLFAMLLWSFRPEQVQPIALENSAVSPMVDYVYDHSQTVTLGDLALVFGYSESHTGKLISAATGMSFSGLLRQARLRRATRLLKNTNLLMNQIALEVGYSDTAYFSRCFKKEFGLPPSEYRRLFATGQNENADAK